MKEKNCMTCVHRDKKVTKKPCRDCYDLKNWEEFTFEGL